MIARQMPRRTFGGLFTVLILSVGVACTSSADDTSAAATDTMEFEQPQAANPCAEANPCAAVTAKPAGRAPLPTVATTIDEFLGDDPGLKDYFDEAAGYAVFPTVGKAGFVVGGAHGSGELIVHGSPVGTTEISEVSVGLQAGGQQFSELIFFESDAGLVGPRTSLHIEKVSSCSREPRVA